MSTKSIGFILAVSAALCWSTFVHAETNDCGMSEETIIIQPEATSYRVIPGEFEWVEGKVAGYAQEYKLVSPQFENGRLIKEAYPISRFRSLEFRDGRTRIQTKRPDYQVIKLPAQTKTYTRRGECQVLSAVTTEAVK